MLEVFTTKSRPEGAWRFSEPPKAAASRYLHLFASSPSASSGYRGSMVTGSGLYNGYKHINPPTPHSLSTLQLPLELQTLFLFAHRTFNLVQSPSKLCVHDNLSS
ncbi:hypothetical protein ACFX13_028907 [Malus domestica]